MDIPEMIVNAEPLFEMGNTSSGEDDFRARVLLSQLGDLGLRALLCPPHPRLLRAIEDTGSSGFDIYPVLLDPGRYSREIQSYGEVGFARRELMKAGPRGILVPALIALRHLRGILRRDFRYASLLLASLEMARLRGSRPALVFLHPQATDLALANGNEEFFRLFASLARGKYGAEPGLMTNNTGVLLSRLDEWDIDILYIAGPVNRSGYLMKPDQSRCEELIVSTERVVIATQVNRVTIPTEKDLAYLHRLNVSSFITEIGGALDAIELIDLMGRRQKNTSQGGSDVQNLRDRGGGFYRQPLGGAASRGGS